MKPPLLGLAAFLIGLAGGTGVGVLRAPSAQPGVKVPVAPESAGSADDSTVVAVPVRGDSVAPPLVPLGATAAPQPGDSTPPAARDTARAIPDPAPQRPAGPTPSDVVQAYEQVARILAGMKPDEAGQILAHLSDAQVEGLVRQMSPRQAAKLLSLIPPERGGLLSRRLLERPGLPRP